MHKLMVLIKSPEDVLALETQWSNEFVGRAERMPGLRRVSVSRIVGALGDGHDLHLIHEFYFDDMQALKSALASTQGQEAGQALMAVAGDYVSIYFAEHLEEAR